MMLQLTQGNIMPVLMLLQLLLPPGLQLPRRQVMVRLNSSCSTKIRRDHESRSILALTRQKQLLKLSMHHLQSVCSSRTALALEVGGGYTAAAGLHAVLPGLGAAIRSAEAPIPA